MRIMATATTMAVLALLGCQDDGPVGPTTQDFKTARQELATKLERGKQKPAAVAIAEAECNHLPNAWACDRSGGVWPDVQLGEAEKCVVAETSDDVRDVACNAARVFKKS